MLDMVAAVVDLRGNFRITLMKNSDGVLRGNVKLTTNLRSGPNGRGGAELA